MTSPSSKATAAEESSPKLGTHLVQEGRPSIERGQTPQDQVHGAGCSHSGASVPRQRAGHQRHRCGQTEPLLLRPSLSITRQTQVAPLRWPHGVALAARGALHQPGRSFLGQTSRHLGRRGRTLPKEGCSRQKQQKEQRPGASRKRIPSAEKPRRWPRGRNMAERTEGGSRHWSFKGQFSFPIQFRIFAECPRA